MNYSGIEIKGFGHALKFMRLTLFFILAVLISGCGYKVLTLKQINLLYEKGYEHGTAISSGTNYMRGYIEGFELRTKGQLKWQMHNR